MQWVVVVSNKQALGVQVICIFQLAMNFVVEVFHHLIFCKVTRHNRPALKPARVQFLNQVATS